MPFRFRRSIRILPGLRLNLGKRGASVSVGVRGAHLTVGHGQVRETVGLPGTGLSYTHVDGTRQEAPGAAPAPAVATHGPIYYVLAAVLAVAIIGAIVATYRVQP